MMNMGEYIKFLRSGGNKYERQWTQEELGLMLNPKVNRAAIAKWETGQVENIKRTYIEQMSEIFGVKPCELMCFQARFDENQLSKEVATIEQIQKVFGKEAVLLLQNFMQLNEAGKEKALKDISDLTDHPKYKL